MSSYVILTDTACDLPESYTKGNNIDVIPLYYTIDNVIYGGEKNLEPSKFYSKMREGMMPTTQAVNPEMARTAMESHLKNEEDILYLAFSSGLSSSCQSAMIAAEELKAEYPNRKIEVIDTLCASLGQGLMVYYSVEKKKQGLSLEENAEYIRSLIPHLVHQFTVDDLFHLHRGGRVSKTVAIIGTMVNVKPVMHVDNEGKLVPTGTCRGRKKSLNKLVDNMEKLAEGYENPMVMISHGDCLEDAEYVKKQVETRLGCKNFLINFVSPTIGAHSGPGTLALFFVGKER